MKENRTRANRTVAPDRLILRLYVAGNAPQSTRAVANLRALCSRHFADNHDIEVVDLFATPLRALQDGILVTPTLVKVAPEPAQTLLGDLGDESVVLLALGLPVQAHEK